MPSPKLPCDSSTGLAVLTSPARALPPNNMAAKRVGAGWLPACALSDQVEHIILGKTWTDLQHLGQWNHDARHALMTVAPAVTVAQTRLRAMRVGLKFASSPFLAS